MLPAVRALRRGLAVSALVLALVALASPGRARPGPAPAPGQAAGPGGSGGPGGAGGGGARPLRLRVAGDIAMAWETGQMIARRELDPFTQLAGALADADLTFANMEMVLSDRPVPKGRVYKQGAPMIRGPSHGAELIAGAGVDIVCLANNHVLDLGARAFADSLDKVRAAGLAWVGVGLTKEEAEAPRIMTVRGTRIGFLAYTMLPNHPEEPGAAVGRLNLPRMLASVKQLRPQVDVLLVSLHWGVQYVPVPTKKQVEMAHAILDAGADAIIGHHPHVLQSIEVHGGKPILYSLGNFIFGTQPHPRDLSAIVELELTPGARPVVTRTTVLPVVLRGTRGSPMVSPGPEGDGVRARLRETSAGFGTTFVEREGLLDVVLR